MKITEVKAVYPKWRRPSTGAWQSHFWQIAVRIDTDTGVTGYGYGGGGEPGATVINRHLRHHLLGRQVGSVDDIRDIWDALYLASLPYGRTGIALMALSGVDLALWDLLGQAEKKPVYDLIGGRTKDRVRAYATGQRFERYRDMGYSAAKFSHRWTVVADYDTAVDLAAQARGVFGPDALVMADCYMSWDAVVVLEMARRLAEFNLYWFEDALTPDHLEAQAALRTQIRPVLLAGGEHDFSHHSFEKIARAGALDLWQPDITWCGGITAGLRIVELAGRHGIPVAPHRGGEIWGLHLMAATGCADLAETHPERWVPPCDELWFDEPRVEDGFIAPLDRPGFGVRLNEAML